MALVQETSLTEFQEKMTLKGFSDKGAEALYWYLDNPDRLNDDYPQDIYFCPEAVESQFIEYDDVFNLFSDYPDIDEYYKDQFTYMDNRGEPVFMPDRDEYGDAVIDLYFLYYAISQCTDCILCEYDSIVIKRY